MEHVDRVSARVFYGALTGFVGGAAYATLKGLPLRSTSLKIAGSFALVGTALFGMEQVAYAALKGKLESERQLHLTTHAFAGVAGGGLNGYLYQKKPLRGMLCFVPVMMGIAVLEIQWEKNKQERVRTLLVEEQEREGQNVSN